MPANDSTQADYLKAGLQLAAFIDGFGTRGPQPDRGAVAAMLLLLLNNAWPLPADLDPEPGKLQASLATMMDAVREGLTNVPGSACHRNDLLYLPCPMLGSSGTDQMPLHGQRGGLDAAQDARLPSYRRTGDSTTASGIWQSHDLRGGRAGAVGLDGRERLRELGRPRKAVGT